MPNFTDLELSTAYRSYWGLYIGSVAPANYLNFKDLGFLIKSYQGAGLPQLTNATVPYGLKGWEIYQGTTVNPRLFVLVGVIEGDSLKDITQKRQRLISLLAPTGGIAPLVYLAFQLVDKGGASVGKQLTVPVHYVSGLEGSIDNIWDEPIALAFEEPAPSQITESTVNNTNVQAAGPIVPGLASSQALAYTRTNGVWATAFSGIGVMQSVLYDSSGDLWAGFNSGGTGGNGAMMRRSFSLVSSFRTTGTLTYINVIREGWEGHLYFGGYGIPEKYIPGTNTWQQIGTDYLNQIYDFVIIPHPTLAGYSICFAVGSFLSGVSSGTLNRIAFVLINGTTAYSSPWNAIGAGFNGDVYCIIQHPNGKLYIGGSFTSFAGTACNNIVEYDPKTGAIAALGVGTNGPVHKLNVAPDGRLLVTGNYSTAGGKTANFHSYWDGFSYEALPGNNSNNSFDPGITRFPMIIDPITGNYLTGSSTGDDGLFNGVDWMWGDISWPGIILDQDIRDSDGEYSVVLAKDTSASSFYLSNGFSITNNSTHEVWPQINIYGTPAVKSIINYTTGKIISFKGNAQFTSQGSVANLQCGGPDGVSLKSSRYGDITNAIAKGSDMSDFNLKPGINYLGILYYGTVDSSNYVQISYQNRHWSFDAATIGV